MSDSAIIPKFEIKVILGFGVILLACIAAYQFTRPKLTICKKSTPLTIATSLESAVNNFFTEYGALPDVGDRVTTENIKLLSILLGLEDQSGKHQNIRNVKFLAVREGKNRKNGLIYNSSGKPEGIFDPWGSPYTVELDVSNGEHLHFTIGSKTVDLKGRRVAAYSPGADKKRGTADDIKTW